jgi:hypothetical protein
VALLAHWRTCENRSEPYSDSEEIRKRLELEEIGSPACKTGRRALDKLTDYYMEYFMKLSEKDCSNGP